MRTRYSNTAVLFHWTVATLVIVNLFLGLVHELVSRPLAGAMLDLHKPIGLLVLLLSLARLIWRLGHRAPPLPPEVPGWQRGLAHAVHWSLYLLMIALPATGWWFVSASATRFPITAFGLFPLPFLAVPSGSLSGGPVHQAHVVLGWIMLALVILHVGAALWHQFGKRDRLIGRMSLKVR